MADTETSKTDRFDEGGHRINRVVCWSVALRYEHRNVFCLYGRRPSELCRFLRDLHEAMPGDRTIVYFHNLTYDWQFTRKFFFEEFGYPVDQLNTKAHYPINIEFKCGLILRDSLILAQVRLEKWGQQMQVEHGKAVSLWDYEKIRDQDTPLSEDELTYIYDDVLCGVECLDRLAERLHKRPFTLPWTMTGIIREATRKEGKRWHAHDAFLKQAFPFDQYLNAERTYHGAFTHANRYFVNHVIRGKITAYDFASSYPAVMVTEKFPAERFMKCPDTSIDGILRYADDYAFIFKLVTTRIRLCDPFCPMPYLQGSKCINVINPVYDNGRILEADACAIWLTEVDLKILAEQYEIEGHVCKEVLFATKAYLPRWFSDLVFSQYRKKCELKTGDKTDYNLAKARVNSLYGMCCQKLVKEVIEEHYPTGEFAPAEDQDLEAMYDRQIRKQGQVLSFQTGIWITAYACYNLFQLGKCGREWLYSDTDSCYFRGVKPGAVEKYNELALEKLRANGYDVIEIDGERYQLGEAALDGEYKEFVAVGAKRYCKRKTSGELEITVAGVPKKGVLDLKDDIRNFRKGFVFRGTTTGKLSHFYSFVEDIYIDEDGSEQGDYIDLDPCDYLLDDIFGKQLLIGEVDLPTYEE